MIRLNLAMLLEKKYVWGNPAWKNSGTSLDLASRFRVAYRSFGIRSFQYLKDLTWEFMLAALEEKLEQRLKKIGIGKNGHGE